MKLQKRGGLMAAVAAGLALCVMAVSFVFGQASCRALPLLPPADIVTGEGHTAREGQVNINTASAAELETLPGIGPGRAKAIVAWRRENGLFRYPEDLIRVEGISEETLKGILDRITVGGE